MHALDISSKHVKIQYCASLCVLQKKNSQTDNICIGQTTKRSDHPRHEFVQVAIYQNSISIPVHVDNTLCQAYRITILYRYIYKSCRYHSCTSCPTLQNLASSSNASSFITVESTSKHTASAFLHICFTSSMVCLLILNAYERNSQYLIEIKNKEKGRMTI